jgi:hypothetical protein
MALRGSPEMRVIVVGVNHRVQRVPPDDTHADQASRARFEASLLAVIAREQVDFIAEEAGDDEEVARELQREADLWAQFTQEPPPRVLPQQTLVRQVAGRTIGTRRYADIRPPSADFPRGQGRPREYERSMFDRTLLEAGEANNVLVICGVDHREPLGQLFRSQGFETEDHDFAWLTGDGRASA